MPARPCPAPAPLSPGPLADTIGYRLRVAQLAAWRRFEGALERFGSAPRHLGLLGIIAHHPGQPQGRLAAAVSLQRSSLVAILDRLEAEGLLQRRPAAGDRRVRTVWLTERGAATVAELTRHARREEDLLAEGMTGAERATLVRLLALAATNAGRQEPSFSEEKEARSP